MKLCLIGPGNTEWHFFKFLKLNKKKFLKELEKIAKILAKLDIELVLLPDKGICFEIAKLYKQYGGKKVIAVLPENDKKWGVKHLLPYLNAEIELNGKKLKVFDEKINSGDWYKQHFMFCLFSEVIFLLGISTGSMYELCDAYYIYKLFRGFKGVKKVMQKQLHPKIVAGLNMPLYTIAYLPFLKQKLPKEIEAYIKKFEADIFYVKNSKELEKILKNITTSQ